MSAVNYIILTFVRTDFCLVFVFFRGIHVQHLPSRARLLPDHEYKLQGSKVTPHTTLLDTRSGSDCISLHRNMRVSYYVNYGCTLNHFSIDITMFPLRDKQCQVRQI